MSIDETKTAVDIAILKEQVNRLKDDVEEHTVATKAQFDELNHKLDEILEVFNKGRGAYAALLVLSGLLGTVLFKGIALAISFLK